MLYLQSNKKQFQTNVLGNFYKHNSGEVGNFLSAPLFSQAFKFFREKYNLTSEVNVEQYRRNDSKKWMFSITWLDKDAMYEHSKITYETYE